MASDMIFKVEIKSPCHGTRKTITVDTSKGGDDGITAIDTQKVKCSWCGKDFDVPAFAIKLSSV
jgi:hypothetical protein